MLLCKNAMRSRERRFSTGVIHTKIDRFEPGKRHLPAPGGEELMESKKVLVAYATRYGSARFVAGEITEYLKGLKMETELVDLRKQKAPKLPGTYDLVVVGSSVAMFQWTARAKAFLRRCRRLKVPTAVYITCGTAIREPQKAREKFMDRVIGRLDISPVFSMVTGPVIDFRPGKGLPESLKGRIQGTIKAMAGDRFEPDGLMDLRNPDDMAAFRKDLEGFLAG